LWARQPLLSPLYSQALALEPVPQGPGRQTIIRVAKRNRFSDRLIRFGHSQEFQTMLHLPHRGAGGFQRHLPLEAVKNLQRLE
jgi:hypothetical protein